MTILHLLSTAVLACIAAGFLARHRPRRHVWWMTFAFVLDLALVLYIEGTRHAVEKALAPTAAIVWVHALLSTLALVGYVAQIVVGRRLLAGAAASRRVHVALGLSFCLVRASSYVTSFMVVQTPAAMVAAAADAGPAVSAATSQSLETGVNRGQIVGR